MGFPLLGYPSPRDAGSLEFLGVGAAAHAPRTLVRGRRDARFLWIPRLGADDRSALRGHGEDVVLTDEHVLVTVELHLGAAVFAEEHGVADLDVDRALLPVLQDLAVADGDDLALDRLLLRRVRDD